MISYLRCYPFNEKGTDSVFEMVKTNFETVGLYTDFRTAYEEARLLTDYYLLTKRRRTSEIEVADRGNDLGAMVLAVASELFYGEMLGNMDKE